MEKIEKSPLISIIVPVYNVVDYLEKSIDSICNQTYNKLQIILIDDGSTDGSSELADRLALNDNRIEVYHIKNGGVSNARNMGLQKAKGDYIGFVDSDDIIEKNMYEKLLEVALQNNVDIVQCQYLYLYEDGSKKNGEFVAPISCRNSLDLCLLFCKEIVNNTACLKLIKKDIIEGLRFDTRLKTGEDAIFVFECCKKAKSFECIDDALYLYFQRKTSAMHATFSMNQLEYLYALDKLAADEENERIIEGLTDKRVRASITILIDATLSKVKNEEINDLRKYVKKHLNYYFKSERATRNNKIKVAIACYFPNFYKKVINRGL